MSGDFDEQVAQGEVVTGEASLFGAEHESHAAAVSESLLDDRLQRGQRDDGLLRLTMRERSGANHEAAIGDGVGEAFRASGILEHLIGADGGLGFAPVGLVGVDDGEMGNAEVGHGASGRSYIERITGRDQDDGEAVALGRGGQTHPF